MEIRKATPSDLDQLVLLWHGLMNHHQVKAGNLAIHYTLAPDSEKRWRQWVLTWINDPDGLVLVAEENGVLVGYSLNFIKSNVPVYKLRKLGYLSDLFVVGQYRGQGIGEKFFEHASAWFKTKGITTLSIAVHSTNSEAKKIYEKWGFSDFHVEMRRRI